MEQKTKKLSDNKVLKVIKKVFSIFITVLLVLIFVVILVQKLTNNKMNLGGYGIYTIATGSMEPVYKVKDMLLASRVDAKNVNVGDDIVYLGKEDSLKGKIIIHRVTHKNYEDGMYKFYTQGIANNLSDPEIDETQVMGIVKGKLHILSFCSHVINNTYGLIFLIVIPFIVFIFMEGKKLIDEAYKE